MTEPLYHTFTLPNGLRIIHRPFPSEISYCGFAINSGTRDEQDDEHGMAHFVEHMLFKGTKKRKAHHIFSRMENVGADLNAYTTKEEIFVYATFLEEYLERAMELLGDIMFNSDFPDVQIEREREVILDEINSYNDSPSELIYDDFENMIFENHALGHYILGTADSLEKFDREKIVRYVSRQCQPHQMVFFSLGKTSFERIQKLAMKLYDTAPVSQNKVVKRLPQTNYVAQELISRKNTSQTHVMLGTTLFGMHDEKRFAAYLLNNLLGGGNMSSRLNVSLREKRGLVYNVESALVFYSDCGVFNTYFACDSKNVSLCEKLIHKEIKRLKQEPLTPVQLNTAKRQLKGQLGISAESNESVALGMAKSFLHFNTYASFAETFEKIDAITATDVQQVAREIWREDTFSILKYI